MRCTADCDNVVWSTVRYDLHTEWASCIQRRRECRHHATGSLRCFSWTTWRRQACTTRQTGPPKGPRCRRDRRISRFPEHKAYLSVPGPGTPHRTLRYSPPSPEWHTQSVSVMTGYACIYAVSVSNDWICVCLCSLHDLYLPESTFRKVSLKKKARGWNHCMLSDKHRVMFHH